MELSNNKMMLLFSATILLVSLYLTYQNYNNVKIMKDLVTNIKNVNSGLINNLESIKSNINSSSDNIKEHASSIEKMILNNNIGPLDELDNKLKGQYNNFKLPDVDTVENENNNDSDILDNYLDKPLENSDSMIVEPSNESEIEINQNFEDLSQNESLQNNVDLTQNNLESENNSESENLVSEDQCLLSDQKDIIDNQSTQNTEVSQNELINEQLDEQNLTNLDENSENLEVDESNDADTESDNENSDTEDLINFEKEISSQNEVSLNTDDDISAEIKNEIDNFINEKHKYDLDNMTLRELKSVASENNIVQKGTKSELLSRVKSSLGYN